LFLKNDITFRIREKYKNKKRLFQNETGVFLLSIGLRLYFIAVFAPVERIV
jgi:hypothetical protein